MRIKTGKVTFQIYHYHRVKHMSSFFGMDMYPLFIRITFNTRSLNFKSHCFDQLLTAKYQNRIYLGNKGPELSEVIQLETELIEQLINKHRDNFSLVRFKEEYDSYTFNLLEKLDEEYKVYMVQFFFEQGMPSIAFLLQSLSWKLTTEMILHDLKRSLSKSVYDKMTTTNLSLALPYIPLVEFSKLYCSSTMGVLLTYHFCKENFKTTMEAFIQAQYPEYRSHHPYNYLRDNLKELLDKSTF